MNRLALVAFGIGTALATGCQLPVSDSAGHDLAEVRLTAVAVGTPINVLVVTVTAADIPTPLVFNLTVQNGVAQGTIRIPPGLQRKITVQAFDTDGNLVADGSKTIDVKPGQNPPVSIPLVSKAGQVTITVTLGPVGVVVQPLAPTVQVGATQQLTATITAANGEDLSSDPEWATTNPAIATVDSKGIVTGVRQGTVDIVATFAGVAGVSHVTVASQIAFVSNRAGGGVYQIYLMNADGTGVVQQLSSLSFASDFEAAWSPDGTKIVFVSTRDGNYEIYAMNADGTNPTRLTTNPATDSDPAWSPDGTKIAFESIRDGNYEIYTMNADGTNQTRLTTNPATDFDPAWSPDGTKIAFESTRDGGDHIWVMNADGTNVVRLTNDPAADLHPAWSPDGTKIAFTSFPPPGFPQIFVMNADGTGVIQLTTGGGGQPAWSPGGAKIAFTSFLNGHQEISVMNADGTGVVRLTNDLVDDLGPRWRPR